MNALLTELEERILELEKESQSKNGTYKSHFNTLRKELQVVYIEKKNLQDMVSKMSLIVTTMSNEFNSMKKENQILSRKFDSMDSIIKEIQQKQDKKEKFEFKMLK
jgi:uncharacterized protein (DUF3084 family)